MKNLLENKIALITGSSRGIGAATARLATAYGATVILHGQAKSPHLKRLARELGSMYIVCDVADRKAVEHSVKKVLATYRRIDVLVNCAGIGNRVPFLKTTDEIWLNVFKVNVLGTVHFCQAVIPSMQKARYGRIVNVASKRAFPVTCGKSAYGVSKAGVVLLTAALAKEVAPHIAVNAVAPGLTETAMVKPLTAKLKKEIKRLLLQRIGRPEDIAEAICFLASDRASFITGQTLLVDGGATVPRVN